MNPTAAIIKNVIANLVIKKKRDIMTLDVKGDLHGRFRIKCAVTATLVSWGV